MPWVIILTFSMKSRIYDNQSLFLWACPSQTYLSKSRLLFNFHVLSMTKTEASGFSLGRIGCQKTIRNHCVSRFITLLMVLYGSLAPFLLHFTCVSEREKHPIFGTHSSWHCSSLWPVCEYFHPSFNGKGPKTSRDRLDQPLYLGHHVLHTRGEFELLVGEGNNSLLFQEAKICQRYWGLTSAPSIFAKSSS